MSDDVCARQIAVLRSRQPRAELPPVTVDGSTATIRFYQSVDDWGEMFGMSATEFADTVDGLPSSVSEIVLRINSPGGMVFEAVTMLNVLRAHPARVVAVVDGVAASAASFLAAGADELVMMPNSRLMIHPVWSVAVGNAAEMREVAELLESLTADLASIYATKSGMSVDEWLELMSSGDLWLSADDAVAMGVADRVDTGSSPDPATSLSAATASVADRVAPGSSAAAPTSLSAATVAAPESSGPMPVDSRRDALALLDLV
jgi:ATP-dependent protease ClpP protease subunit